MEANTQPAGNRGRDRSAFAWEQLRLQGVAEGTRFALRAVPGARRDAILGVHGDALRAAVRAVAEKGRANQALIELLGAALDVRPGRIEIVAGSGSRDKSVLVRGLGPEAVRERLRTACSHGSAEPLGGERR